MNASRPRRRRLAPLVLTAALASGIALSIACGSSDPPAMPSADGGTTSGTNGGTNGATSAATNSGATRGATSGATTGATSGATSAAANGGTSGTTNGTATAGGARLYVGPGAADAFDGIPKEALDAARAKLRVLYGHLSHGAQVVDGMEFLRDADPTKYAFDKTFLSELNTCLDPRPNYPDWYEATREELAGGGKDRNVVLWAWSSWIGDPADVDEAHVRDRYLARMEKLEADYPNVQFVYATGPAMGPDATPRNKQIRDYANARGKLLFDVEAIELTDPAGTYHASGTDECEWCTSWCASNACPAVSCPDYNHTHCFQSYRKARAFFWMAARLGGWTG